MKGPASDEAEGAMMPTITFTHPTGEITEVEVGDGVSIMRAALQNGVSGIIGECGGQAMCATCHVYVADNVRLPPPSEDEEEMLECTAEERTDASRLGCQVRAGADFDTISVQLPARQV